MTALPQHLAAFVDACPDAVVLTDADQSIAWMNPAAELLCGYSRAELLHQPLTRMVRHRDGVAPVCPNAWEAKCLLRKDGAQMKIVVLSTQVPAGAGMLLCHTLRDEVLGPGMEQRLAELRDEAAQAVRAKNDFIAATAHDLRQPLQALSIINATLQRQNVPADILTALQGQHRAIEALSELLNSLLSISRLESGKVPLDFAEVSVSRVFDDLRVQFEPQARAKHLGLTFHADASLVVSTDRGLLFDLLQNLISNAIRYTDRGGVEVRCSRQGGDRVSIEVVDTGIGIGADVLARIWEDFYQVAMPHRGGSGLGLGIVRRVAPLLRAEVDVNSVPGQGTRFEVQMGGARIAAASPAKPKTASSAQRDCTGTSVIFIDDNASLRKATSAYLALDGYAVHGAGSLQEVDALLGSLAGPPGIVISDFRLSGDERGSDVIARIRAQYGRGLPAIVLTGDPATVPRELSRDACTRVLGKPIDAPVLTETMCELLNRASAARDLGVATG